MVGFPARAGWRCSFCGMPFETGLLRLGLRTVRKLEPLGHVRCVKYNSGMYLLILLFTINTTWLCTPVLSTVLKRAVHVIFLHDTSKRLIYLSRNPGSFFYIIYCTYICTLCNDCLYIPPIDTVDASTIHYLLQQLAGG